MTPRFTLSPIEAKTKGEVRRLRVAGFVPVSIQHKGMPTQHFQQEAAPLNEFILQHGDAALLDLWITPGDRRQRAIVQEVQRHPITHHLMQVTFQQIRHDDTLKTHVSLVFVGEPGEVHRKEAIVQHQLDRLDVECNQDNLPDRITVDVASLRLGDVFRVSDLPADPRYKIMTPPETVLASLSSNRSGASQEETTETAPEVEVVA